MRFPTTLLQYFLPIAVLLGIGGLLVFETPRKVVVNNPTREVSQSMRPNIVRIPEERGPQEVGALASVRRDDNEDLRSSVEQQFQGVTPREWGETLPGIKTQLDTKEKVIALTFDACGGEQKDGYDRKLIEFLEQEHIPATLFIGGLWIDANRDVFLNLAENPLFEIENHGARHQMCSVNGRSMYGLVSDQNVGGVMDEIETNARKIESLTGRKPTFYRPAGAYTDEVCPQIAQALGERMVNFNVLGDAGATYNRDQVKAALLAAKPGSIVIMHMNHPEKDTAEGVMVALPELRAQGFRFVRLEELPLK